MSGKPRKRTVRFIFIIRKGATISLSSKNEVVDALVELKSKAELSKCKMKMAPKGQNIYEVIAESNYQYGYFSTYLDRFKPFFQKKTGDASVFAADCW